MSASRALEIIEGLLVLLEKHSDSQMSKLYDEKKDGLSKETYEFSPEHGFCHDKKETRATNRFKNKVIIITGAAGNFGTVCAHRFASEGAQIALWDLKEPSAVKDQISKQHKVHVESYVVDVTDEDKVNQATEQVAKDFGRIDYLFNNGIISFLFFLIFLTRLKFFQTIQITFYMCPLLPLLASAGYQGDFVKTHLYSVKDFRKILDINVTGVFIALKGNFFIKKGSHDHICTTSLSSPPKLIIIPYRFGLLTAVANQMIKQKPQGGAIVNTASMAGHGRKFVSALC
ncbi:short chain dehydrogenase [Reticulomyxa filosa]|uniref:Short chain dehydrogenase n=1 Tax=Reticulomyxa filosa TaxID=46433 RepID=X6M757_RETFI|nr:short chain dehydrogenase [Reticulomyxa filosa]|eukprot:ETO09828.1 short chain dehydrogenase [Reticulomyxa filosa]